MPSRSGFLTAANAGSMSISGEKSQRAMLSALLSQAEADQSLLRKEKEAAEAEVRRLMGQLIENASMEKEKASSSGKNAVGSTATICAAGAVSRRLSGPHPMSVTLAGGTSYPTPKRPA